MKLRALASPAPPVAQQIDGRTAPQKPPVRPPELYAVVADRDERGLPTRLALPLPLAGRQVGLYVQRQDGSPAYAAAVSEDGAVARDGYKGFPTRDHELSVIKPGTKIIASADARGRVVALMALARLPAAGPPKPKRRDAPTPATHARSGDKFAHDPGEVLIAGAGGRVMRVY